MAEIEPLTHSFSCRVDGCSSGQIMYGTGRYSDICRVRVYALVLPEGTVAGRHHLLNDISTSVPELSSAEHP